MRRFFNKLKYDTKGAVTIFFLLIIAVVFAFNAVLIDYARIMSAEQQAEYAVQSGVRSAMAGYENDLREYGLFGVDESSVESDFEDLLKANIEATSNEDTFNFINPKVESAEIDFSRALANPEILEHQILEEMKYKAPVEVVKELIEKFSFLTTALKETSAFVDTAEKIQDDFEDREELLDEVEGEYESLQEQISLFRENLTHDEYSNYPNVSFFTDVVHHYSTYSQTDSDISQLENENVATEESNEDIQDQLEEMRTELEDLEKVESGEELDPPMTIEELEEEIEKLEEEIEDKENQLEVNDQNFSDNEAEIEQLREDSEIFKEQAEAKASEMYTLSSDIVDSLKNIRESIDEAKELNENIANAVNDANDEAQENYGEAEQHVEPPRGGIGTDSVDDVAGAIEETSAKLDDYPYESEFFDHILEATDEAITNVEDLPSLFEELKTDIDSSSVQAVLQAKNDALNMINTGRTEVDSGADKLDNDRKEFEEDQEKSMEEHEEDAEESRDEAEGDFGDIENLAGNLEEDSDAYIELADLVNDYEEFIEGVDQDVPELDFSGDAGNSGKSAMNIVDTIFNGIGNILNSSRDRLYINEYILLHFESAEPTSITNSDDYLFENREVEYILYGQHEVGMNYSMALGQLFALRFAIRFIDAFMQTEVRSAGHPLAIFIAAVAYALKSSIEDTNNLAKSDSVPLINDELTSTRALPVVYKDYLRLFLFINPSGDARLRRIMAVIEKNTGVSLAERQTYVQGSVKTSENLIFLPQIADTLNLVGAIDGQSDDGKFVFEKEAHFSY
ncbi:hypothetical protein SAMN04487943_11086 [Gracilibacillus orientalis]|uniref:Flp pilus-assembly TadE/G-like n=1 Tax=Gracilibacillus orientalis TaxID=334253 RepID=A0A1I4P5B9_9BACI|nr:DUF5702 domain-containing protein [Gracilibacillus orientalis]SFM22978.1 hypothetical protein SAMN04487943_11086 [Gracilibacillus orientalis]